MQNSKKHHFLPQFYLSGFAIPAKTTHVWQIEKEQSARRYQVNIKDAAELGNYHTITGSDGNRDGNTVEQALSRVEAAQCALLRRITGKGPLQTGDRHLLAEFVALMDVRVPSFKAYVERECQTASQALMKTLLNGGRLEHALATDGGSKFASYPPHIQKVFADRLREMIANDRFAFEVPNARLLNTMFSHAQEPQLLKLIERMGVTIFEAPATATFIAGDTPVSRFYPRSLGPGQHGAGLADPSIQLVIPLSARFLACLTGSSAMFEYKVATVADVAEFNRRTIITANELLFAPQAAADALELIRANCQFRAGRDVNLYQGAPAGGCISLSRTVPVFPSEYYGDRSSLGTKG